MKQVKLTHNLMWGPERLHLLKPWPYNNPMPGAEQQGTATTRGSGSPRTKVWWVWAEHTDRRTLFRVSEQWGGGQVQRVGEFFFFFFFNRVQALSRQQLGLVGRGHQRTRRCWRWRISLIKDSINILQLSGKGLVARWPAIWWASTPGFVIFSEKAGA